MTRALWTEADRLTKHLKKRYLPANEAAAILAQPLTADNCSLLKLVATDRTVPPLQLPEPALVRMRSCGADVDLQRCCLMLAFGLHHRVGVDSPLRMLAGNVCLVQQIASLANIYVPGFQHIWVPPPRERVELHRLLRDQLGSILSYREQLGELKVQLRCMARERDQSVRHAASSLAELERSRSVWMSERTELEERLRRSGAMCLKLERQIGSKPLKLQRQHDMDVRMLLDEADAHRVQCLRLQEAELREYHQRAFDEREAAIAENLELQHAVATLQTQLDRVRCSSKVGLMEQVAELQQKLREANARRTLNQRRVSDANLAERRAQLYKRQAIQTQMAVNQYSLLGEQEQGAREAQLEKRVAELEGKLAQVTSREQAFKQVAEPPKSKFYRNGFEPVIELAAIEAMLAGASCNAVPRLFVIFARAFGVTIPVRNEEGTSVPVRKVDGKMVYEKKLLLCIPSRTHCKGLMGVLNQLHKLQVGEWLQCAENCCYISDGAESLQRDWCAHLLSRRDENGKLDLMHVDVTQLMSKASERQAESFRSSLSFIAETCKKAGVTEEISPLITGFKPVASMNDRAAAARKAARLVLGSQEGDDDPTCAEHALVNTLEEARKAIDGILRQMMQITDEQAASDAAKIKAMRTAVGWFSSPACALIYQVRS